MKAEDLLRISLAAECEWLYGFRDAAFLESVVGSWMDDENNSRHRFDELGPYLPEGARILDMASGCGTCVFHGLLRGYDIYGVEPEGWKNEFNRRKAEEYGYPEDWCDRFVEGVGEDLPFPDGYFDAVTSYQTLEHVRDPYACILEMVRVTRPGGYMHIRCPDYRGTFEPHYRVPWLPLMPRPLAKLYLRALRRPVRGLATINYVTRPRIQRWMEMACEQRGVRPRMQAVPRNPSPARERKWKGRDVGLTGRLRMALARARRLFRQEENVNLMFWIVMD